VSKDPVAVAVSLVVIAHDHDEEHVFPGRLRLKPLDAVAWHTNPDPVDHSERSFTVTFVDASPFDQTVIHGKVGESTPVVTVKGDAAKGSYTYSVELQTSKGSRRYDPEIIIEEAVPVEPPTRAATRTAGGGA
jgi:hypothetical protein